MGRNTLLLVMALTVLLLGAFILMQTTPTATSVTTDEGTKVQAPGTRVESNDDQTRIQAPGVDITVPSKNDGD
jgi:hypothetical protein